MPTYKYTAKDSEGKTIAGITDAQDNDELIRTLREKGLIIISVSEAKKRSGLADASIFKETITLEDLVIFSRQLATMVNSGIPIVNALDILGEQVEKKSFQKVLLDVRDEVESGKSLSEGMKKHKDTFSTLFVNMVKAGETSGTLDEILDRLAAYMEKASALQKKIKSALVYPAVVSGMALAVTALLIIVVIPIFKDIYGGFSAKLPIPTQIMINVSDIVRKYFVLCVIVIGAAIFLAARFAKTTKGRLFFDTLSLRLPIFGALNRKVAVSKFTRTLSTLVRSGVPILTGLDIVGKTSGNMVIERAVEDVRASIKEGETIAGPLQKSGVFPPMVVRMVAVGEKTGQLDKMLSKIADFYDNQVDTAVSGLTSMLEPLIIAFLGILIGGIVICMFLPIFRLSSVMSGGG